MKPVRYIGSSGTGVKVSYPDPSRPRATKVVSCKPGETVQLPDPIADAYVAGGIFAADEPAEEKPKRAKTTEQKEAD